MKRALVLALLLLLVVPAIAAAAPREYVLPGSGVFPEGVTVRPGTDQFFVSSTSDGTIFRGTLGKARTKVFLEPGRNGRALANGLHATRDKLIVTGSLTGLIFVYDLPSGRLVRRFATGTGGLINDATVTPDGDAYVTDSRRGLLFHIPARALARRTERTKRLQPFVRFSDTPVGSYSNGVVGAGARYLLVVGTASGALVRVDRETGRVRAVDLGDDSLPAGDGLARSGRTLYAVNAASRVTQLSAIAGRRLLVVNSQFDKRVLTPVLPFTVSAVARP